MAASPSPRRRRCQNGHAAKHRSTAKNGKCLACQRAAYIRWKKRRDAERRNRVYVSDCYGCGEELRSKGAPRVICAACKKIPAAVHKARVARARVLDEERDKAALAQLEASKRPILKRTPWGAEELIRRVQRGGL